MKKILSAIVCFILVFGLVGCAPKAVKKTQKSIEKIGEVTVKSIEQIQTANRLYDALTEEEKTQVENYNVLEKANKRLAEILYAEIKIQIEDSAKLESGFFAQYYDVNALVKARTNAQNAVDNSNVDEYVGVYQTLKKEVEAFNNYIKTEQEKSLSKITGNGDFPFAVKEFEVECCGSSYIKQSSDYPVQPSFFDSDTTDERPIFLFEMKDDVCVYSYELRNTETKWIQVQDENGEFKKAFVNTELVLYDAPDSWMPNNELYPLGEGDCYLFVNKDKGITLAIKDLVDGKGYILYSF